MSFEDFRASLLNADQRAALGIQLSDADAQLVVADPASAQNWYGYWLSTLPQTPPPPAAPAPAPQPTPAPETTQQPAPSPEPQHAATLPYEATPAPFPGDVQQTLPIHDTAVHDPQQPTAYAAASPYPDYAASPAEAPAKKSRVGLWVTLSILFALILIAVLVVIFALVTARHWVKTDVAAQPETFHSEEYKTGSYDVTMDTVDPCWVDQDWTDCINAMAAQYDANCAGVTLTDTATSLCSDYLAEIDRMRAEDTGDFIVATLGGWGSLHRTEEVSTRQVSNNDDKPAVTHKAVCYLGFLGECK